MKRQIYCASPFTVYQDEIERCYAWFWQRMADAQLRALNAA